MREAARRNILRIVIILAIIGVLTSIYLVKNHFAPPEEGSLCDLGETVSCSVVNTSIYSELFHVPVAVFGAVWCLFLALLGLRAMEGSGASPRLLVGWCAAGTLFVLYMIAAEIILGALCPFCTLVHVIVLISLVLSLMLYKAEIKRLKHKTILKAAKPWIGAAIALTVIPLILFNLPSGDDVNHDALAKCLAEKGVRMYGSYVCSGCRSQERKFGESFQYIDYVECHPRGPNPQTDLCLERDLPHTPAWILEKDGVEVKRLEGYQRLETLAEFAGCQLEETENG